jgi:hypothetical protein
VYGIRSLLAAEVINGSFNLGGRIDIEDAAGTILLTVPSRKRSPSQARDTEKPIRENDLR